MPTDHGAAALLGRLGHSLRLTPSAPATGIRSLGHRLRLGRREKASYLALEPIFAIVDTPVAEAGRRTIAVYTPGTLRFERPVEADTTLTVTVQVRKNAEYEIAGLFQGFHAIHSWLPRLEIEREDGLLASDEMADVDDTWDGLEAALPILADGVVLIRLIAAGAIGDNLWTLRESQRPPIPGPRCWWGDLDVSVA